MKNRAKCKLCSSIIESFHPTDYVLCNCGEISVDGGDGMRCSARNWQNFLRVDDEGNEIIIKIKESLSKDSGNDNNHEENNKKSREEDSNKHEMPTKKQLLNMLEEMIKNIEALPTHAMSLPINHYDFSSLLILLLALLKDDCSSDI